jgi:hypothetical protein
MDSPSDYEKIKFSNKFFMYSSPEWKHDHPIVDLIKCFNKHTVIHFLYGKGSKTIKIYSTQYNHRLIGCDLNNKNDYSTVFKRGKIECLFIFADSESTITTNLINFCKSNKINVVLFSTNDYLYHYNDNTYSSPQELFEEVINNIMISPFLDNFDLVPQVEENVSLNLTKCLETLKIRDQEEETLREYRKIKCFDPHFKILKDHKREILKKNTVIKDDLPINNTNKNTVIIQKFFKKIT